ncbi:uncharacterized protein LOC120663733 isoform X2 [Panicum virgatum]|uniref:uncharacterized protein LOC120663733 isoform X2 n=1 Tax=Panicum virgatum TaxID=38727 RepID=UPI0019D4F778|nr:uncharacterized protein LOC120663733 isoform X2 [Panicum virgatum]
MPAVELRKTTSCLDLQPHCAAHLRRHRPLLLRRPGPRDVEGVNKTSRLPDDLRCRVIALMRCPIVTQAPPEALPRHAAPPHRRCCGFGYPPNVPPNPGAASPRTPAPAELVPSRIGGVGEESAELEIPRDGTVVELNESNFDAVVRAMDCLFVEFYAPWCSHCNRLTPQCCRLRGCTHGLQEVQLRHTRGVEADSNDIWSVDDCSNKLAVDTDDKQFHAFIACRGCQALASNPFRFRNFILPFILHARK